MIYHLFAYLSLYLFASLAFILLVYLKQIVPVELF